MDEQSKASYAKPVISEYGRVTQFTQGGTGKNGDGVGQGKLPL